MYEWKIVNADVFTEAQDALNQLDKQGFEILVTHSFSHSGHNYLTIIARKHKPQTDIRY
jgi:hypothetical protein